MENVQNGVNVAPSSTSGHYVKNARKVVEIDNVNESFFVEGESELVTKNHTSLTSDSDTLITTQKVYNPFSKKFEKAKD